MLRDVVQRDELTLGIAASGAIRSSRGSVLTFYSEGNRYVIQDQTDNVDGYEKEEQCMFVCFDSNSLDRRVGAAENQHRKNPKLWMGTQSLACGSLRTEVQEEFDGLSLLLMRRFETKPVGSNGQAVRDERR
ncbi:hypothetical protein KOW79_001105 [Hemibagrus wyckioides]|uniref:Uncharacterized protein n=1 Tax=Hemibagrus wyckioides TaxID=337641 RepID=A0A9D3STR9_9TELE|nr:hypothetical protein KOW79_001105 [Hemibagrus wyckioides]